MTTFNKALTESSYIRYYDGDNKPKLGTKASEIRPTIFNFTLADFDASPGDVFTSSKSPGMLYRVVAVRKPVDGVYEECKPRYYDKVVFDWVEPKSAKRDVRRRKKLNQWSDTVFPCILLEPVFSMNFANVGKKVSRTRKQHVPYVRFKRFWTKVDMVELGRTYAQLGHFIESYIKSKQCQG